MRRGTYHVNAAHDQVFHGRDGKRVWYTIRVSAHLTDANRHGIPAGHVSSQRPPATPLVGVPVLTNQKIVADVTPTCQSHVLLLHLLNSLS